MKWENMGLTYYSPQVEEMRSFHDGGGLRSVAFRKSLLLKLRRMLEQSQDLIVEAVHKDIGRPKEETVCFELLQTLAEIDEFVHSLDQWSRPEKVERFLLQSLDKDAYILRESLGLVLIVAPWNYPVLLLLLPLVGALGGGNCAVLKPSELAPHTSALMAKLLKSTLPPSVVTVVEGGAAETTELLRERFDHVFYTGSERVARIVMAAAAKHLTPVTLELGGKCPAIFDRKLSRLETAVKRVAWGKFISCGQTCIAPDHLICFESELERILPAMESALELLYGKDVQKTPDYSRMINQRQFDRVVGLLERTKGKVAIGGERDRADLYIAPTVVTGVSVDDSLMEEEIFGPVLPILTVSSVAEAVRLVEERTSRGLKPLALYVFTDSDDVAQDVLSRTTSGGATVNDVILHLSLDTLPFGGVGSSGMGKYHGHFSFQTFTNAKAVLHRRLVGESLLWMRYPPYSQDKLWWARRVFAKRRLPQWGWWARLLGTLLLGLLLGHYVLPALLSKTQ